MQTIHYNISDKKALSTPDKPVLVAGESGTSEIVLSSVPAAWEGFEIRALLTTPTRKLVDAFAVGSGFLLTNTMLDAQGYLYIEFVAYRGGTEIDRSLPDKLCVNAGRKELGDIGPAPLPDLVAEMVAAKGDCDGAAAAAVLATERIEATDAEVKAAEAVRETDEQERKAAETARAGFYDGFNAEIANINKALPDVEAQDTTKIVNMLTNPDFSVGISPWIGVLANGTVNNGTLTFLATAMYGNYRQIIPTALIKGHKYYVAARVKASSYQVELYPSQANGSSLGAGTEKGHSGSGNFENLSLVFTATGDYAGALFKITDYRSSGWSSVVVEWCMFIDLTATYGLGFEPSLSQFEATLSAQNSGLMFASPLMVTNAYGTRPPLYVDFHNDILNVISKYSGTSDIRVEMKKRGVNNIFEFANFYTIPNSKSAVSSDIAAGTILCASGTDWMGPFIVRAVNNIDGDKTASAEFTGGNHGYNGDGTGTPTGRTASVSMYVDGRAVGAYSGYANFIDINKTNYVQATNTKKSAGGGREVLKETCHIHFDGYKWTTENEIEFLEACTLSEYYGIQCVNTAWNTSVFYHSSANRIANATTAHSDSGGKTCDRMTLNKDGNYMDVGLDLARGIGRFELLAASYNAFTESYGKSYFFLSSGFNSIGAGEILSLSGYWRFYRR